MSLPPNFSDTEHLQDTIRRVYNKQMRDWFKDLNFENLDLNVPRSHIAKAVRHEESDSLQLTLSRQLLAEFLLLQRWQQLAALMGERPMNYRVMRKSRPQIILWFVEDGDDVDPEYDPIAGRISFRLMSETTQSMTEAKARVYAQRIKTQFGASGGKLWRKGKELYSYTDWDEGYQLQLLCRSESEAKDLVRDTLAIQSHTPDWEYLNLVTNDQPSAAYPTIPPLERVMGEMVRLPRRRPIAVVRFQYALLKLAGKPTPLCLYDRSGRYPEPLIPG